MSEAAPPVDQLPPVASAPRIWGFWGTLGWALVMFAVMIATSVVALVALMAARGDGPGVDATALAGDGIVVAVGGIASTLPLVGVVWLAIRIARNRFADYLCFVRPTGRQFLAGLVAVALLLPAMDVVAWLLGFPITPQVVIDALVSAREKGVLWLLLLAVLVSAPVCEEIVFRGFLYRGFAASWLGPTGVVLLTAAMFALIHTQYTWFYLGEVFAIGLMFGAARALSGTTLLPIAMHCLHNAAALVQAHWLSGQ